MSPKIQQDKPRLFSFSGTFWAFLFAENLYDTGIYIFVLLYNLYLLDLGYREDFLGWITAAMSVGSIVGSLPAAVIVRRLGLKRTLIFASLGVPLMSACRATALSGPWMVATAFFSGVISAIWAVSLVPIVATLTTERNRAFGYTLWTAWGMGLGVPCGILAGALPGWISRANADIDPTTAKHISLLLGAGIALLSPILLARLPLEGPIAAGPKIFPRSAFVRRYIIAFTIWNIAIGVFTPFFSAYFARQLHLSVSQIGFIFSISQLAQLGALTSAPFILRRFGFVRGISMMQAGAAVALALLATGPSAAVAAVVYAMYSSFQNMSEPGLFAFLMSAVDPAERAGLSSLTFFVTALSQAVAAAVAGVAVVRFGYQAVLIFGAAAAALSAFLFQRLLLRFNPS